MKYVAFLRGINVSGQKIIKMENLREMFSSFGFKNVTTYIQSGNVLFETAKTNAQTLTKKIESGLQKALGYDVTVLVRTVDEMVEIVKRNPFKNIKADEEKLLYVTLFVFVLNIVLNIILIPLSIQNFNNGTIGASMATAISFLILGIITMRMASKYNNLNIFDDSSYKIIFSAFISLGIVYTFRKIIGSTDKIMFFVYLIIYVAIYLFILYKVKFFEKKDMNLIRGMFKK